MSVELKIDIIEGALKSFWYVSYHYSPYYFLSIIDYPDPPKELMYVATLYNITLHWKYQLFGSGDNIGVLIDVRKRNEAEKLLTVSKKGNITSLMLKDMQSFNDYVLTFYVVSSVGRSYPRVMKATTYFRSEIILCA